MPLTPSIRTALIFTNPLLCSGLRHILQETPFVLAEAIPAIDLGRGQPLRLELALVIIEAGRDTDRALQIVKQVREQSPEAQVVAITDRLDLGFVRQGHMAGVKGFCSAASSPDVLIKCLELVMLGESVFPSEVLRLIEKETARDQNEPIQDEPTAASVADLTSYRLSAREAEILRCLIDGASNKEIARKLDVTEATIKVHVKAILRKIGAANRTQAALWASQRLWRGARA